MSGIAIIGGSGLAGLPATCVESVPVTTVVGEPSAPVLRYAAGAREVLFLARHGAPHRIPPHRVNYRANLLALQQLGATRIVALNAVGGIDPALRAGDFVLPDDLIDYTWGRAHTFSDGVDGLPVRHVDFTRPFDAPLASRLAEALRARAAVVHEGGTYGVAQGPRLETAAEIRRLARDGCRIVGMTAMPEAALARELGLRYAMVCLVTNPAAGVGPGVLEAEAMAAAAQSGMAVAAAAVLDWVADGA